MPFIILDRDGVINYDSDQYIKSPDEWLPIPGSLHAIAQLNKAGFRILIATNQSGVARGHYTLETLHAIHEKLVQELASVGGFIDEIFFCPHHPNEACHCRKPNPGMLYQIQEKYRLNFAETFYIGDSYVDYLAAKAVGCKMLLVKTGNGEKALTQYPELASVPAFTDLAAAVQFVVSETVNQRRENND